jgi:glycosyltransferase involved in cell wall biosynthesis
MGTGAHVTILMATRNGARHLPEQLASLVVQTHRDWSLWASDDGSTDATRAILAEFGESRPVRIVEGPQRGAAANFLSLLCHPDLEPGHVALADQDDVWLKGKLARALRRMGGGDGRPTLYAAESLVTDADLRPRRVSRADAGRAGFGNALVQNLFGGHTTVLDPAAHALVRAAGVPEGVAFHDWWIYQLVAGAGGRLILDPAPMALYRVHGGSSFGASGFGRRARMVLGREFGAMMEAQAEALWRVRHLLRPEAVEVLDAFRSAPRAGPARVAALRRLGIARASPRGTAALMAGALFGRF